MKESTVALLTVAVAVAALAYAMWSDQKSRNCEFLDRTNNRLIELDETMKAIESKYEFEFPDTTGGSVRIEQIEPFATFAVEMLVLINRYQYVFSIEQVQAARASLRRQRSILATDPNSIVDLDNLTNLWWASDEVIEIKTTIESELQKVGDRLRTCKS